MKEEILSHFPVFSTLPKREIRYLAEVLNEVKVQAGEIVLKEGASNQAFYILLEGEVEVYKSLGTSDERLLAVRGSGSLVGEMSFFSVDGVHSASVRARTPLTLLEMTSNEFEALLRRYPPFAVDMVRIMSQRLVDAENLTIADLREKNRLLTQAYNELKAAQAEMIEKKRLERELEIAGDIQRSILPAELPVSSGYHFGALMVPARLVGGDFYDFIRLDDNRLAIVVGDVCDKGMAAALFMALSYSAVRSEAWRSMDPGGVLRAVNHHLLQINQSGMFVTLLYGILECADHRFTYARAGHPHPLVLDRDHRPVEIPTMKGQPVGLFENLALDVQCTTIPPGGTMLIYSDGLSESLEGSSIDMTVPQLCASIQANKPISAQELCDQLWRALGASTSESFIQDDFTVVAVQG